METIMNKSRPMAKFMAMVMMTLFAIGALGGQANAEALSITINSNHGTYISDAIKAANTATGGSKTEGGNFRVPSERATADGKDVTIITHSGSEVKFDAEAFKNGKQREVKKGMKAFFESLQNSGMPLDAQQSLVESIQSTDSDVAAMMIPMVFDSTRADIYTAYRWVSPFLQALRVVFGVGSILIVLLLLGSTIMDMMYIGLPVWRESQSDKGNKNPIGVSYEAITTVKEIEKNLGDGDYKNAYVLYLKRRATTYIVLSICLMYLIVGELGGLIGWILNLASGVVG